MKSSVKMAGQKSECSTDQDKGSGITDQIECAICLQNCVYPVQLPCKHIFCYLCVKGVTLQSKKCAMCRREIPQDYLFNPELINQEEEEEGGGQLFDDEFQWFYEGRNGWWQYDKRTSLEIENHHKNGSARCELLIAGFLYIIDFEHMLQYRRNDPSRRRKVKRDVATGPKKGVAGLRIGVEAEPPSGSPDTDTDHTPALSQSSDGVVQGSDALHRLRVSTQSSENLERLRDSIQSSENLQVRRSMQNEEDGGTSDDDDGGNDNFAVGSVNYGEVGVRARAQVEDITNRLVNLDIEEDFLDESDEHII